MRNRELPVAAEQGAEAVPERPRRRYSAGAKDIVKVMSSDVLWWAKYAQREPFLTAARRIERSNTKVAHVLWPLEGEMVLIYAEKQKPRRRE